MTEVVLFAAKCSWRGVESPTVQVPGTLGPTMTAFWYG